jgi:hypothetical protein
MRHANLRDWRGFSLSGGLTCEFAEQNRKKNNLKTPRVWFPAVHSLRFKLPRYNRKRYARASSSIG